MKAIALVGLPGFIALFLLGAIPGLPSPIIETQQSVLEHDRNTGRLLSLICQGVWKDSDLMQAECAVERVRRRRR